jgi:hypothetical protein
MVGVCFGARWGGGVGAAFDPGAAVVVSFVTDGVREGLGRVWIGDGVAGPVELGVELAEGESTGGLPQERQAQRPEFAATDQGGSLRDRWKDFFVGDVAATSSAAPAVDRPDLFVDVFDPFEQVLTAGGEIEHVLVQRADFVSQLVFFPEQVLEAGVGDPPAVAAKWNKVAAMHVGRAGDGG